MTTTSMKSGCSAAALIAVLLASSAAYPQSAPFNGLAGVWSGNGSISLDTGATERLRCKATYSVSSEGNGLNQSLVCASDSYKFDLRSNVLANGGVISGTWTETSRNVGGNLQGRAGNGHFDVVVSAPTFNANLSLNTKGNKQTVTITSDSSIKGASIVLSRS